ncbi:proprotein convertase P-domain-containing protein [Myxococcota bacterium]|nr:proprotein convertase P-domain-containing protein [Myxococcota bacterium]
MPHHKLIAASLLLLGASACLDAPDGKVAESTEGKQESAERIDTRNDPNRFQLDFSRSWAALPASGESTRKPFPSNWWPMRQGGIARRWNGTELSPAEKYDQLITPTEVREVTLTLAQRDWRGEPTNAGAQPETMRLGPAAEWEHRNHGRHGDTDPDSWWGHCNGWSSYVLNEDEPIRPVTVRYDATAQRVVECATASEAGCVRFELGDINALGAELYWSDAARMLGRRCEQEASEFTFDASGRINAVECRDGNAGAFHLVATNMIGRLTRPFIVDLTADFQVWNYPVYRFELTRNEEITLPEALEAIDAPTSTTTWTYNASATRWVRVQLKAWIVEDAIPPTTQPVGGLIDRYTTFEYYDYILELDAAGTILGGEWIGESKRRHPDFLWYSYSNSAYSSASDDQWDGDNPSIRYSYWKQILTLAQRVPESGGGNSGGSTEPVRASVSPALAIPDNVAAGVTSSLEITESVSPTAVRLTVDITHTYRGDLRVVLTRGTQSITLHDRTGGSTDNLRTTYDVPALVGVDARGTWTLTVSDLDRADVGTLVSWSLELTRPAAGGGGGGTGPVTRELAATPNLAIPDANTTGVQSTITFDEELRVDDLRVDVVITHPYIGDLTVTLSNGTATQVLHRREGGSADDIRRTFETAAFRNASARGTWTLSVVDGAARDVGTLASWRLIVTGTR